MGIQAIAIVEEATRGTDPGSGYQWLPVTGSLMPTFNATDESRTEFRGADSALGNAEASLVRRESQTTFALECVWYPGAEIGLLMKHLLGKDGTRAVIDTSGYKGPMYPLAQPYGTDNELGTTAIGVYVLYDKEGTTYKRYYGGMRPFDCSIAAEGTDDIKLTFNLKAPGAYVGDEAVNDLTPAYTSLPSPFVASDLLCYIGTAVSVTGSAPDYTDIGPGTMTQFCPESVNITLTSGNDDKVQMCGIQGPSKTFRSGQFLVETAINMDLEDPSTGFSSWDEFDKKFGGATTNTLLFVFDNEELAGAATETYETTIFLPANLANQETPSFASDGTQPTVALNYSSLYDSTALSPLIIQTIDKTSAY
jgi:hypothetical protein